MFRKKQWFKSLTLTCVKPMLGAVYFKYGKIYIT